MNYRKSVRLIVIAGFLSLIVPPLSIQSSSQSQNPSQDDNKSRNDDQIIRCPVLVIGVRVEVTDRQGKEITNLTKDDFIIYEDGVKEELQFWKRHIGTNRQPDEAMYEAGYLPDTRHFRGEWRKIRIEVRKQDERKPKVRYSPNGYYARKELVP